MYVRESSIEKPGVGVPAITATLSLNILALAMPLVILQIFDRVITNGSLETLALLILGLLAVVAGETVLRTARVTLLSSVSENYERDLTEKFVSRTLAADPTTYAKTTEAEHLERFAAIGRLRDSYAGQGRLASLELPFAIIFIGMIGVIGGWLVVVPIVGVALLLWFTSMLVRKQEPVFEERNTLDARRYAFLIEILSQMSTIKLNTMEKQMLRRFEMMQSKAIENSRWTILYSGLSQSFGAVYAQTALVAMGLFGGFLVIQDRIGIAELAACMLLNGRTIQPFVKMLGVWAQSESVAASEKKLSAALRIPAPAHASPPISDLASGEVVFEGVTVTNPDTGRPVFEGLDARILPGDCVSILGENVDSQSMLLRTVLGETLPHLGRVTIDGDEVGACWPPRGANGVVLEGTRPAIFNGNILQNISAFGDGTSIERALELSHKLGLEDRVHRLPMGYNTELGGQSSLILDPSSLKLVSLIRAFVIGPRVLLLHDPTRGVERHSRSVLVTHLAEAMHDTTVIVASNDDLLIGASDDTLHLTRNDPDQWNQDRFEDTGTLSARSLAS